MASKSREQPGLSCWIRLALLLVLGMISASCCQAKNNCPWMNEATASGLLGGDATGEFTDATSGQAAVCSFTQKDAAMSRTLQITVLETAEYAAGYQSAARACGADAAPLQAIGNQAVACIFDDRKGALGERAVGRVRDQIFTITISSSLKGDTILTRATLKAKIYTAAEQVAGNLF